jgi:hypothetical protein
VVRTVAVAGQAIAGTVAATDADLSLRAILVTSALVGFSSLPFSFALSLLLTAAEFLHVSVRM